MAHLQDLLEESWRRGIKANDIVYMNTSLNIISEQGCDVWGFSGKVIVVVYRVAVE